MTTAWPLSAAAVLALLGGLGASGAAAQSQPGTEPERPIVLDTEGLQEGDTFECRIPLDLRYEGERRLEQITIVAGAYAGGEQLGSTGVTGGDRPVTAEPTEGGLDYRAVPLQFSLGERQCRMIDGLRIAFATCSYADGATEHCLERVRFAAAEDDPLFLPIAPSPR